MPAKLRENLLARYAYSQEVQSYFFDNEPTHTVSHKYERYLLSVLAVLQQLEVIN